MARPRSRPGLSDTKQREVCWYLAIGSTQADAARLAGYPDTRRLSDYAKTKEFAVELRQAINDRLSLTLAPKAVAALDAIVSDEKVNARIRVDAAKAILDRAGHSTVESAARPKESEGDPMETWPIDRLQKFVANFEARLETEQSRRAEAALPLNLHGGDIPGWLD